MRSGPASTGSKPSFATSDMTTGFFDSSSPATNMTGRTGNSAALSMLSAPIWLSVLNTDAAGAHDATCSPPEIVWPSTSSNPFGPMPRGLVLSRTILPERSPRLFTAALVAGQGVARTTTSAFRIASGPVCSLSSGSERYLGSAGLGTPNITSSPPASHARPSADPTLPAPIMAILISIPVEGGICFRLADCRVGAAPAVYPSDVTSGRRCSQPQQPVQRTG